VSLEIVAAVLLGGLFLLLLIGMEIFLAFGIMASIGILLFVAAEPQNQLAWTSWVTLNVFSFTAVPLFIFMGEMFSNTGVIRYLFDGANKWLGGLPGGLGCSVTGACALFGAMSGSSVAATATFGRIAYPEMEKQGYDPKLGLGVIAIGGTLSVLIPPSIILIIYGGWQAQSIVRLFAAAMIPGMMLSLLIILTIMVMVWRKPSLAPKPFQSTWGEKMSALVKLLPWLGTVAVVLGVIFGGIMTPTEAASMGAFLSLVLAAGYRRLSFKVIKESFLGAAKVTAMIGLIIAMAQVLSHVFLSTGIGEAVTEFIINLPFGKYGILVAIYVMYLILGCFFDSISMMVLTLPFIAPVISDLGFSLLWFGVTYVLLAEVGLVTPPFGLNLFVLHGVVPKHGILTVARGALPFLIPTLFMVLLLTVFPELALWLPKVLY
jgi:tripartite ATP-independent transporter DctM subunit